MTPEQQLNLISLAWGDQDGYCFFPWISGTAKDKEERVMSYREGPAFHWPHEKDKILEHMRAHTGDDLYWCPSLFEKNERKIEYAMDEHALWADLDEVDPRNLSDDLKPTIAWETSPGRYQGLWLIMRGFDIQGASWAGGENQRLTYHVGADSGGWDTTQLLRIPGWGNHKPQYRKENKGKPYQGKLLWHDKSRRYLPDHFNDLPELDVHTKGMGDVLETEIDRVDRHEVWGKVRLKVNKTVREYMTAREVSGDRSEVLWQIERELADAGCSVTEIVALVRPTVWNKYAGRADELRRLTSEAYKAIEQRPDDIVDQLEAEAERPKPYKLGTALKNIKRPEWIVDGIWSIGACGFIAGQPKSFKSWLGLDMASSVATGMPFLGHFRVTNPGPVLYMQEEDGAAILKQRTDKIWPGKQADRMKVHEDGAVVWEPGEEGGDLEDAPLYSYIREGFILSDPSWQSWLDEVMGELELRMLVLDPLMMMAGDVEENRAQEMTSKIFRPLKQLAEKHGTAIALVHHMRKQGQGTDGVRGGQLMLGSVANHAWAEDSLYVKLSRGDLLVERESKHTTSGSFRISRLRNREWTPVVMDEKGDLDEHADEDTTVRTAKAKEPQKRGEVGSRVVQALKEMGPGVYRTSDIARKADLTTDAARRQLNRSDKVMSMGAGKWALIRKGKA